MSMVAGMERRRPHLAPVPVNGAPAVERPGGAYRVRMDGVLDRAERVRAELAAVRETAGTADGAVVATVDGSGALTGLRFGPRATTLSPERLAELVLAAAADAASSAARRAARLVEGLSTEPAELRVGTEHGACGAARPH